MFTPVKRLGNTISIAVVVGLVVLATAGAAAAWRLNSTYRVTLVLPSAAQLVDSSPVWIDGNQIGQVDRIEVRDGKALVGLALDGEAAPLHQGTTSRVEWMSVLGERVVTLYPGPAQNAALPSGAMLDAPSAQIEVDDVLSALDPPTRDRVASLLRNLNGTVTGKEGEIKATLDAAGPAVSALGRVLEGVGRDGAAIKRLVEELHQVTGPLAERQDQVRSTVSDLTQLTGQIAPTQKAIRDGLKELPPTLDTAKQSLDMVPAATDATVPLLNDLGTSTERLPSVARSLSPLLRDLRPTVADLRPTLMAGSALLDRTPGLLDTAHGTLPPLTSTLKEYLPALSFLRPYAPEIVGVANTWGNAFSGYDGQGHVWAGTPAVGGSTEVDESPFGLPAGIDQRPAPGALVDQPWTDATGDEMR